MTIEERLEKLVERHEYLTERHLALTQTLKMMAIGNQTTQALVREIAGGIRDLVAIVRSDEHCIASLER